MSVCLSSALIYVDSADGEGCHDQENDTCIDINDLETISDNFSNTTGLIVHFLEGTHLLDLAELVVFTNLTNAMFEGEGRMEQGFHETVQQSTVVIKCTQHSGGIAFVGGFNITFRYLTITNCGASASSFIVSNFQQFSNATLSFIYAGNIFVSSTSVQNSSGCGLMVFLNGAGTDLEIVDSTFTKNNAKYGGNLFLIYTDPPDCNPITNVSKMQLINTNVSHGTGGFNYSGISIRLLQRLYFVDLNLSSVIAHANAGSGNIAIFARETVVPMYKLTISKTQSSGAQGFGLTVFTEPIRPNDNECSYYKNSQVSHSDNLRIFVINSEFTDNEMTKTSNRDLDIFAI